MNPEAIVPTPSPPQYVPPAVEMEQHVSALEALLLAAPGDVSTNMVARIRALGERAANAMHQQSSYPAAQHQQQPQ